MATDVISIDFGGVTTAAMNWNEFTRDDPGANFDHTETNLIRISDGADTGVSLEVTGMDSSASGSNTQGSGSSDSTIFSDHIQSFGNDNDTLTFTISGLNDSLTYDLTGGFFRPSTAAAADTFGHTWNVQGDSRQNDFVTDVGVDGYESFTGLTSTGGVLTFTITDTVNAGRASISELTLTAVPEPSSTLLLTLAGLGFITRRNR